MENPDQRQCEERENEHLQSQRERGLHWLRRLKSRRDARKPQACHHGGKATYSNWTKPTVDTDSTPRHWHIRG